MSRFYAEIQGSRGKASRQGGISSGIWSHTRGWTSGVEVKCSVDDNDKDVIEVYVTSGSGGYSSGRLLATIDDEGKVVHYGQRCRTLVRQEENGHTD